MRWLHVPWLLWAMLLALISHCPTLRASRRVCTSPYWPLSNCDFTDPAGAFTGYEVELWRRAADAVTVTGHADWGNWTFVCIESWDLLLTELLKPASVRRCDVVVAGVSATPQRIAKGLHFSYPTYQSGRRILVHGTHDRSIWWWTKPFEPRLWLLFFGTSAAIGLTIFLVELPWSTIWSHPLPSLAKACNLQWGVAALLMHSTPHLAPRSPGGRLMLLAFALMALVVTNLYTAAATARMVQESSSKQVINGIEDLTKRTIGIFADDKQAFERFALEKLVFYSWNTKQQQDTMLSDLRSGVVDALVVDAPWAESIVADDCDLYTVGSLILPVNLGFVFPPDTSNLYLADIDSALSQLEDRGVYSELQHSIVQHTLRCQSLASHPSDLTIRLHQVAGLWVIIAAAVAVGFVWNGALWCFRGRQARQAGAGVSRASTGVGRTSVEASSKTKHGERPSGASTHYNKASADDVEECGLGPHLPCLMNCMPLLGPSIPGASVSDSWIPIAEAATVDEAIQVVDARIRYMDNHIKHLPWVLSAIMDAKMSSIRSEMARTLSTVSGTMSAGAGASLGKQSGPWGGGVARRSPAQDTIQPRPPARAALAPSHGALAPLAGTPRSTTLAEGLPGGSGHGSSEQELYRCHVPVVLMQRSGAGVSSLRGSVSGGSVASAQGASPSAPAAMPHLSRRSSQHISKVEDTA